VGRTHRQVGEGWRIGVLTGGLGGEVHGILVARVLPLRRGSEAPHRCAATGPRTRTNQLKSANLLGPPPRATTTPPAVPPRNGPALAAAFAAERRRVRDLGVRADLGRRRGVGGTEAEGLRRLRLQPWLLLARRSETPRRDEAGRAGERRRRGGAGSVGAGSGTD